MNSPCDPAAGTPTIERNYARGPGSASAHDHDLDLRSMLFDDAKSIHQRGEYNDCRSVLVIMENRNVKLLAQPPLDLEAAWR